MLIGEIQKNSTEKSTGNYSYLLWESEKIQNLFSKATVTVTTVTKKATVKDITVTEVTDVTVNPENEVIDLEHEEVEIVE